MSEPAAGYRGPTPAYVYDLAAVRDACDRLRALLPQPSELYYSLKANPHPDVVAELHRRSCRAEVTSAGELRAAAEAGVPPRDVLYTGPGKKDEDLDTALAAGVRLFSVDSAHAVRQLARAAARHGTTAGFVLRVNPERAATATGLTMAGLPSAFGADLAAIRAEAAEFTRYPRAVCRGLHLYLATNLFDEEALVGQFLIAVEAAVQVRDVLGVPFEILDLGGGFAAPYARAGDLPDYPALAGRLGAALDEAFPGWREGSPTVAFEAGRYLAATCGRLYSRVLDAKSSHGRRVLVLDSGIHHLGGMAGLKRVPPIRPDVLRGPGAGPAAREPEPGPEPEPAMVCGPLCTPLDTWTSSAPVGDARPGDVLSVPNVGAYGLHASLALFLGHPLPAEVVVDGGRHVGTTRLTLHRTATTPEEGHDDGDRVHRPAPPAPALPAQ